MLWRNWRSEQGFDIKPPPTSISTRWGTTFEAIHWWCHNDEVHRFSLFLAAKFLDDEPSVNKIRLLYSTSAATINGSACFISYHTKPLADAITWSQGTGALVPYVWDRLTNVQATLAAVAAAAPNQPLMHNAEWLLVFTAAAKKLKDKMSFAYRENRFMAASRLFVPHQRNLLSNDLTDYKVTTFLVFVFRLLL